MAKQDEESFLNSDTLNEWVNSYDDPTEAVAKLVRTGLGLYTLYEMLGGRYSKTVRRTTKLALKRVTGLGEELFSSAPTRGKKAS
jgi:hypothetical protein